MPTFTVLWIYSRCLVTILHDRSIVLLAKMSLVFIVPLAELEVALTLQRRLDVFLFFLNQAS